MKLCAWQHLSEYISKLFVATCIGSLNNMILNLVTNKVTINFNVFRSFMKHGIRCDVHSSLVVTKESHRKISWKTKISKKTLKPYHFASSRCHGAIFSFS